MMLGGWGAPPPIIIQFAFLHHGLTKALTSVVWRYESDSLIDAANKAIIEEHKTLSLLCEIYEDQPYVFMYSQKES